MTAPASPIVALTPARSRFEPSTVPNRKSAVSTPSRRTPTNATSASASDDPVARARSTWPSSSFLIDRAWRRIQKIIQVSNEAAKSIADPSKIFSALPWSWAPITKSKAAVMVLSASAIPPPIHTGRNASRRPVRFRNARTIPTIREASKPSRNIRIPAPTVLLRSRVRGTLQRALSTIFEPVATTRHSVDEYLETIYFLAFPIGEYSPQGGGSSPTLASRVAEMLGVSRASAGEMLKRLEKEGLVRRGEHKEALLTKKGRDRAEKVVRKHRIVERLLTDFMGYTAAEAHVYADDIGETFSDDMVERMEEKLGNPDRCPHGWPVDPAFEQAENEELSALAELEPGSKATIIRLAEHDGDLLHWFYEEGFVPGTKIELREAQQAAGQFTVRRGG